MATEAAFHLVQWYKKAYIESKKPLPPYVNWLRTSLYDKAFLFQEPSMLPNRSFRIHTANDDVIRNKISRFYNLIPKRVSSGKEQSHKN
jgi:hypothetical protein